MKRLVLLSSAALALACGEDKGKAHGSFPAAGSSSSCFGIECYPPASGGSAGQGGEGGAAGASAGTQASGAGTAAEVGGSGSGGNAGRTGTGAAGGTATGGATGAGGADQGGAAGAGGVISMAPIVRITSPIAVADPSTAGVLITDQIQVLCEVSASDAPGAMPVNPSTVKIEMLDAKGVQLDQVSASPTLTKSIEYGATLQLTSLPDDTGPIVFRCSASDRTTPAHASSDTIATYVDHGPKIEVRSPVADAQLALVGATDFEYTVTPDPVANPDPGAALSSVTLEVDGNPVPQLAERTDLPGVFRASVNFQDAQVFPRTPTGQVPVIVRAMDRREALRVESYEIMVDGEGPVIKIVSPAEKTVVGSQIELEFTVEDALSGVEPSTVEVSVNDVKYVYDPQGQWAHQNNAFTFRFSSGQIEGAQVQATIDINAKDKVGNPATGASLILYMDNQPPVLDLDPPNVRERNSAGECSDSFDPVGAAANDLSTVKAVALFRVKVEDETNSAPGLLVAHFAGVQQSEVYLYLQPNPQIPLLIDTNGDKVCDELATVVGTTVLPYHKLNPVPPQGNPNYGGGTDFTTAVPYVIEDPLTGDPPPCRPGSGSKPPALCIPPVSDLTRVINAATVGTEPAIYAIGTMSGLECTGSQWEIQQYVTGDTWLCLAARAVDGVGNVGISRPLRVCMDFDGDETTAPNCPLPAPTCTDGCETPPPMRPEIIQRQ